MKAKGLIYGAMVPLCGLAARAAEAAKGFNESPGIGALAAFHQHHPIVTAFANIFGLLIVLGLAAIAISALDRRPGSN